MYLYSMKKYILTLVSCVIACFVSAQPLPCGSPAAMTSFCKDACIICDIDGFTGINNSTTTGEAPPGFCTSYVHHMQWIAFIAGTTDVAIEMSVTNCNNPGSGGGLEVGIYKSLDCKKYELVSNCDTDIPNNTKETFINTVPLIVGQYYYFVMDGSDGDVCNYTLKVTKGSTKVPPLPNSGKLLGDFNPCEGGTYKYQNSGVLGAINYEWTIDGLPFGKGQNIMATLLKPGNYNVCCTASNVCDKAAPTCQSIEVKPKKTSIVSLPLCKGTCLKIADTTLCKGGSYTLKTKASNGCDSIISLSITEFETSTDDVSFNFCESDTFFIANKAFTKGGLYTIKLQTVNGCDSVLNVTLNEIICKIQANSQFTAASCAGQKSGSINFKITNGTPPFLYTVQQIGNDLYKASGSIPALNQNINIPNLAAGNYLIYINDNFGNSRILQEIVTQPDSISITFNAPKVGAFNLACAGDANASVGVNISGGSPPYLYNWSNGSNAQQLSKLKAGVYTLTITDKKGCTFSENVTITEPASITYDVTFVNPSCDGFLTGVVNIKNLTGGEKPYLYFLNNQSFTKPEELTKLGAGIYELYIQDANGCKSKISKGTLVAPEIPVIDLGADKEINLGESTILNLSSFNQLPKIAWVQKAGLSCIDCRNPVVNPYFTTTYNVSVTSKDGCVTKDDITVKVNKNYRVFVPTAFTPGNQDGVNDRLTLFGNIAVAKVKVFQVYDRWGELVFSANDFIANNEAYGWDGTFRGKKQNNNVYTWLAEVEYLDGETEQLKGDVTLME
jgi:gliding motility-associated-like protein